MLGFPVLDICCIGEHNNRAAYVGHVTYGDKVITHVLSMARFVYGPWLLASEMGQRLLVKVVLGVGVRVVHGYALLYAPRLLSLGCRRAPLCALSIDVARNLLFLSASTGV